MEIKSGRAGRPKGTPQIDRAVDILKECLGAGPCSYREIRGATRNIGWRTVEKAAKKLRVISQREQGYYFWRLPGVAVTDGLSVPQTDLAVNEPEEVDQGMETFAAEQKAFEEAEKERMRTIIEGLIGFSPDHRHAKLQKASWGIIKKLVDELSTAATPETIALRNEVDAENIRRKKETQ